MVKAKHKIITTTIIILFFSGGLASGGNVAGHGVNINVQPIDEISVSGNPRLNIDHASAGQKLTEATRKSGNCAITTNGTGKKIWARISQSMPADTTLKLHVAAPPGSGISRGNLVLTTSAAAVVTGIGPVANSSLAITYNLNAGVKAGEISPDDRTVTFILSD